MLGGSSAGGIWAHKPLLPDSAALCSPMGEREMPETIRRIIMFILLIMDSPVPKDVLDSGVQSVMGS